MATRRFLFIVTAAAALAGCATSSSPMSVADTIAAKPQLSTLNGMLARTGLTETLKTPGPFTVFAPSNEAFAKIPGETLEGLAADPAKLKAVLTYHVVPGKVIAADVRNSNSKTVNGANVALSRAGDFVTVEDALVVTPDLAATNGVVHIVDSVLMPPAASR